MAAYVRVVEAHGFTAAAERLGWSKSVISRRIAELEERLGVRLLNRSTRRLSLTEAGRAYYERCVRILADIEESEAAVASLHAEPRGRLRVSAPMTFGMLHLAPALRIGTLADSALVARRLAPCRRIACAAPSYLAERGEPGTPAELAGHDCLLYSYLAAADQWSFADAAGAEQAVRVAGRLRVNNGDVLRDIAIAGLGIVMLPTFIVAGALADGRLRPVLCDWRPAEVALHAVYPHNRHLSSKVRTFVDFLVARFGPEPYWDAPLRKVLEAAGGTVA